MVLNKQTKTWSSDFGKEYTERNIYSPTELDTFYTNQFGVTRRNMNEEFLSEFIDKEAKILEVGCNVGNQLRLLQEMGYKNLYGIELQDYAVEKAKELTNGINIIKGSGDDLPFRDGYFDLVFTSGVLIHIPPSILEKVQTEILRCTNSYVWGFEYFSEKYQEVNYRGNEAMMWKGDFCQLYQDIASVKVIKYETYKYKENENLDQMFLLRK
ncbi:MAG: methyltransferase domain-containing protein [Clostridiales bacterium]|nr:methyltransferase domain-containing protein [Clostridiales bacterium]